MTSQIVLNKYAGRERPVDLSGEVELAYEAIRRGNVFEAQVSYREILEARRSEDIDTENLDESHVRMFIKIGILLNKSKRDRRRK